MSFINALQWRSPAAAALLAMLVLAGCAAGVDDDPDAESNPRADDSSGAATIAEPEPSAEPPPTAPARPATARSKATLPRRDPQQAKSPSNSCTSPTAPRSSG
ncbi:hypothetical protein [Glycomyces sp. YM15]|uniref:hypothetical protein n=1 Tax=Glycomyces sp. YM15 TaxID=2800446 RepID=UPI0019634CC2|nr:hypothetical protein [Glycomyces sp. YM15]